MQPESGKGKFIIYILAYPAEKFNTTARPVIGQALRMNMILRGDILWRSFAPSETKYGTMVDDTYMTRDPEEVSGA